MRVAAFLAVLVPRLLVPRDAELERQADEEGKEEDGDDGERPPRERARGPGGRRGRIGYHTLTNVQRAGRSSGRVPALDGGTVFLDNAGGSQVLARVADRIRDYLLHDNVQLGASYAASQRAGERVAAARRADHVAATARGEGERAALRLRLSAGTLCTSLNVRSRSVVPMGWVIDTTFLSSPETSIMACAWPRRSDS